jgi:hypothetical protein
MGLREKTFMRMTLNAAALLSICLAEAWGCSVSALSAVLRKKAQPFGKAGGIQTHGMILLLSFLQSLHKSPGVFGRFRMERKFLFQNRNNRGGCGLSVVRRVRAEGGAALRPCPARLFGMHGKNWMKQF